MWTTRSILFEAFDLGILLASINAQSTPGRERKMAGLSGVAGVVFLLDTFSQNVAMAVLTSTILLTVGISSLGRRSHANSLIWITPLAAIAGGFYDFSFFCCRLALFLALARAPWNSPFDDRA